MGIILLISWLAVGVGFTFVIIRNIAVLKKKLITDSIVTARLISEYCVSPLDFGQKEGVEEILKKLETIPSIVVGCIYDNNGEVFGLFKKSEDEAIPPLLEENISSVFKGNYLHIQQPIIYRNHKYGTILLKASTAHLDDEINRHLLTMAILMIVVMVLCYFLARRLQLIISEPILKLAALTEKISGKTDYSLRVEKQGNDEIGVLYDGFNNMLDQIHMREQERDKAEEMLETASSELKKYSESLEQMVKLRTKELEKKTIELEKEVTIRKTIEGKLRTEKAYIDQLFESAQEAIVVTEKDGRVLRANDEFIRLFGYSINELLGKSFDDLIASKEYHDEAVSVTKKVLEGKKVIFETIRQNKDGTLIYVSVLGSPIIVDGKLVALYGIYRDITELKRAEEALEERSKELSEANIRLKELDRLKSMFIASMSHELRTPLNSIIGFTGIILQGMSGEINEEQKKQLTFVKSSANHLLGLNNK